MAGKNSLLFLALVALLSLLPGIAVAEIEFLPKVGVPTIARWVKTPVVHRRTRPTACDADDVVKALRRFSTSAVPFCSSFLHIPKSTVTTTVVSGPFESSGGMSLGFQVAETT